MAEEPSHQVDTALRRMRRTVTICCLIVIASLLTQTAVWALVSFTDMRYKEVQPDRETEAHIKQQLVVKHSEPSVIRPSIVGEPSVLDTAPLDPIRVRTRWDLFFRDLSGMALGAGVLALFVLMVLITVMVIVVANAAAPTLNDAVAGMTWAVIVTVLVLPTEGVIHLPWGDSALRPYAEIIRQVEGVQASGAHMDYYVKFLLVPLICSFATIVVASRFATVARNWLPPRQPYLDPEIEDEVSKIRPTSLHGSGRSAAVFSQVVGEERRASGSEMPPPAVAGSAKDPTRPIGQPDPGQMPRRII